MEKILIKHKALFLAVGIVLLFFGARVEKIDLGRAVNECTLEFDAVEEPEKHEACFKVRTQEMRDSRNLKANALIIPGLLLAGAGGYGYFLKRKNP